MITAIATGISSTIGLAREKHFDHKQRKSALAASERSREEPLNDSLEEDDRPAATDEQDWALDEAGNSLSREDSSYSRDLTEEGAIERLVMDTTTSAAQSQTHAPLPYPIMIPQRRPGTKSRGFSRAYPPDLENFGIDQETFLRFLKNLHSASQASPVLHALYITASATSPIHGMITFAVSISVTVTLSAIMELQTRYKANTFLDEMNRDLFMPRGLYAMVLVYKPDESSEAPSAPGVGIETINLETAKRISKWGLTQPQATSSASSSSKKIIRPFRNASGKLMMPLEVAPLIYPGLDRALHDPDFHRKESFKERFKRNRKFASDYYDRRHTAEFTGNNAPSVLSSTTSTASFHSRFADPNHPVNNGSITALVTGGKYGHAYPGAVGWRETGEDGKLKPVNRVEDAKLKDVLGPISLVSYGVGIGLKGFRKVLGSDVMYLAIVNMPSEEELEVARKVVEENKTGIAGLFKGKP